MDAHLFIASPLPLGRIGLLLSSGGGAGFLGLGNLALPLGLVFRFSLTIVVGLSDAANCRSGYGERWAVHIRIRMVFMPGP